MAVRKATRSNPQAQPLTQQAKTRLAGGPEAQPQQVRRSDTPNKDSIKDPQLKAQLFDTLSRLNRGYGIAVAALDRLRKQTAGNGPGLSLQPASTTSATARKNCGLRPIATCSG